MNVRNHLENMRKRCGMYASNRESFVAQVSGCLIMLDIDTNSLWHIDMPPGNVFSHLVEELKHPKDDWVDKVIEAALALLPEGSGEFTFTQVKGPDNE
jgi:hypothetical protein